MRNMLAFVAAGVIGFAAVGWYMDWYRLGTRPAPAGQQSVTIDINTKKIGHDIHQVNEEIHKKLAEKAHEGEGPTTAEKSEKGVAEGSGRRTLPAVQVAPAEKPEKGVAGPARAVQSTWDGVTNWDR